MECSVLFTDEFGRWWEDLSVEEQISIAAVVRLLESHGAALGYPYSAGIATSRYSHMRELCVQYQGRPYPVCLRPKPRGGAIDWWRQDRKQPLV